VEQHNKFAAPFVFGCLVSEEGHFKLQYADGIMGLSMYTQTLVGEWFRHGSIAQNSFSLCLSREGGHISIGGTGLSHDRPSKQNGRPVYGKINLSPMRFTPFAKLNVWYFSVTVTSISVGAVVLPNRILQFVNDHKGTIVDSGTTDTFISHKVEMEFAAAWEKVTGRSYNNRLQNYTHKEFNELPIILFELQGGVRWEINPVAYMEINSSPNWTENTKLHDQDPWEGMREFSSRIYVDEPAGMVLGSNAMMDKEVYFDIANKMIGVGKSPCVY
jgi:hypothetical protein